VISLWKSKVGTWASAHSKKCEQKHCCSCIPAQILLDFLLTTMNWLQRFLTAWPDLWACLTGFGCFFSLLCTATDVGPRGGPGDLLLIGSTMKSALTSFHVPHQCMQHLVICHVNTMSAVNTNQCFRYASKYTCTPSVCDSQLL